MESEKLLKDPKLLKKIVDLPQINKSLSSSNMELQEKPKFIRIREGFHSPKSTLKEINQLRSEPSERNSTLHYFPQQSSLSSHKLAKSINEQADKVSLFISKMKKSDWKNEELRKINESRNTKDLTNYLIFKDKTSRKMNSLDTSTTMKSNLTNVNFSKLSTTKIKKLPKPEIKEEALKENLKEFIGMNKYPIDYKEINFAAPKMNFIRFEPLKTHMNAMKQNVDKSKIFYYF